MPRPRTLHHIVICPEAPEEQTINGARGQRLEQSNVRTFGYQGGTWSLTCLDRPGWTGTGQGRDRDEGQKKEFPQLSTD